MLVQRGSETRAKSERNGGERGGSDEPRGECAGVGAFRGKRWGGAYMQSIFTI